MGRLNSKRLCYFRVGPRHDMSLAQSLATRCLIGSAVCVSGQRQHKPTISVWLLLPLENAMLSVADRLMNSEGIKTTRLPMNTTLTIARFIRHQDAGFHPILAGFEPGSSAGPRP